MASTIIQLYYIMNEKYSVYVKKNKYLKFKSDKIDRFLLKYIIFRNYTHCLL